MKENGNEREVFLSVEDRIAFLGRPGDGGGLRAVVADNTDYTIRFFLSEDWREAQKASVLFVTDGGDVYVREIDTSAPECDVPVVRGTEQLRVGLTALMDSGERKATSTPALLRVLRSVTEEAGEVLNEPEPTLWEQVLARTLRPVTATEDMTVPVGRGEDGALWTAAIQADYEQNDENAADYIRNRPFYEKPGEVLRRTLRGVAQSETELALTLSWGTLSGLADEEVTAISYGDVRRSCAVVRDENDRITLLADDEVLVELDPNESGKEIRLSASGFTAGYSYVVGIYVKGTELKKLEEKYLPDTVAIYDRGQSNTFPVRSTLGGKTWKSFSLESIERGDFLLAKVCRESAASLPETAGEETTLQIVENAALFQTEQALLLRATDAEKEKSVSFPVVKNDDGVWSGVGVETETGGLYSMTAREDGEEIVVRFRRLL